MTIVLRQATPANVESRNRIWSTRMVIGVALVKQGWNKILVRLYTANSPIIMYTIGDCVVSVRYNQRCPSSLEGSFITVLTRSENVIHFSPNKRIYCTSADLEVKLMQLYHCDGVQTDYWYALLTTIKFSTVLMSLCLEPPLLYIIREVKQAPLDTVRRWHK